MQIELAKTLIFSLVLILYCFLGNSTTHITITYKDLSRRVSQKEKDLILILAASQNDLDSFKEIELMGANLQGTKEGCHGCDSLFNACYNGSKGKSLSEGLILATITPKYDNSLFIELRVQYMSCT